jgi:hypothetical protein
MKSWQVACIVTQLLLSLLADSTPKGLRRFYRVRVVY